MTRHRFEALDGMRGVAAIAVLLFHVFYSSARWVFPHGYLAVDFFLLSGFVIGYAYEHRLASGYSVLDFAYARFVRLYPLIAAGALIGLFGYSRLYEPRVLVMAFIAGLLVIPTSLAPKSEGYPAMPLNPPSWSLFYEVVVNIVFAVLVPFLNNVMIGIIVTVFAIGLVAAIACFGSGDFGPFWPNFAGGALRVGFSFFAGVAIHRIWRGGMLKAVRVPLWALLAALIVILLIPNGGILSGPYDAICILVAFPFVVAAGANVDVSIRNLPYCILLGELSYPIYILQGGLFPHIRDLPSKLGLHGAPSATIIIFLSMMYVVFAWAALRFYDEPLRRRLNRLRRFRAVST